MSVQYIRVGNKLAQKLGKFLEQHFHELSPELRELYIDCQLSKRIEHGRKDVHSK